ncbi:MAG TPA: GNAT family N-acetyltransferase [Polyangia bacterium]|nr:GNAT family N-acetyltransferase [Polyangia bacterium]
MEAPTLEAIVLGTAKVAALQALHLRCHEFIEQTTGVPPRDDEAVALLKHLPPGKSPADKQVLGVMADEEMIGVVELLRDHPQLRDWYIGLLLLVPQSRGAGLGSSLVDEIVQRVRAADGAALHLIVRENNPRAIAFWRRHHFEEIDRRIQDLGTQRNLVLKMVRRL